MSLITDTSAVPDVDVPALNALLDGQYAEVRRLVRTNLVEHAGILDDAELMGRDEFRERVLEAYRHQCALCHLKHDELLDAAHIIPDADPEGEPVVSNGLALCRLHHSAFDKFFIGVRPDYRIEVRPDLLEEEDGLSNSDEPK